MSIITLHATSTTGYATMFTNENYSFVVRGDSFTSHLATVAANVAARVGVEVADVTIERTASICGGKGCVKATIIHD